MALTVLMITVGIILLMSACMYMGWWMGVNRLVCCKRCGVITLQDMIDWVVRSINNDPLSADKKAEYMALLCWLRELRDCRRGYRSSYDRHL